MLCYSQYVSTLFPNTESSNDRWVFIVKWSVPIDAESKDHYNKNLLECAVYMKGPLASYMWWMN